MDLPLPQLLNEALRASPHEADLSKRAVLEALDREATRSRASARLHFLLSAGTVAAVPHAAALLRSRHTPAWTWIAAAATLAAAWAGTRSHEADTGARFRAASRMNALSGILTGVVLLFLLVIVARGDAWLAAGFPSLGSPGFLAFLVIGLPAASLLLWAWIRKLDPYRMD